VLRKAPIVDQFRYARFTLEDCTSDKAMMARVDRAPCITFGQFRHVAKQQGWTAEHLAKPAHGP
jgi:hypothetical protein